jgi:predicted N-acetyltransferase YhbS
MEIDYKINVKIDLDKVIELYIDSTLGERRPVQDRQCMAQMMEEADLVVTAWDGDVLVGIARSLTDWCYCAYLSDLAVRLSYQKKGIGRQLVHRSQQALGPNATLILLSAPAAVDYYPRIGMQNHPSAWILRPGESVMG